MKIGRRAIALFASFGSGLPPASGVAPPFFDGEVKEHRRRRIPGICVIVGCKEPVAPQTDPAWEEILCAGHRAYYSHNCACGCGRRIVDVERDGYRPDCWFRCTEAGRRCKRNAMRLRMRRLRRVQSLKSKALRARRAAAVPVAV